jgi:hypothetical protein
MPSLETAKSASATVISLRFCSRQQIGGFWKAALEEKLVRSNLSTPLLLYIYTTFDVGFLAFWQFMGRLYRLASHYGLMGRKHGKTGALPEKSLYSLSFRAHVN